MTFCQSECQIRKYLHYFCREITKDVFCHLICRSGFDLDNLSFNWRSDIFMPTRTHIHALTTPSVSWVEIYQKIISMSQQLHLTAACLSHFVPCEKGLHFLLVPQPPVPLRMFIAQKIISLVISAPLWAAINFSSLHDGPSCGHRSLTFSKRSINLSVHPATYPLMFSSSLVFFFFSLAADC